MDMDEKEEWMKQVPVVVSIRHKTNMNRIFRELVGGDFIPYPKAETPSGRARLRFVKRVDQLIERNRGKYRL